MERRPGMDTPRAAPAPPAPVSAALALGLAFVLAAGDAAAQNLCAGDVVTGRTTIAVCDRSASETRDVHIDLRNPAISLTGYNESPVTADTYGVGSVTIEVTGGSLSSSGNWAKGIRSWSNGGSGDVAVTVKDVDITTANDNGNAVYVRRQAGTGNIRIDVSGGVLTTTGGGVSQGITGWAQVAGDIDIDTKDVVMRTEGANSLGIFGYQQGPTGDVDVAVQGGSIETNGFLAHGVYSGKIGGTGNADLSVSGASVTTRGRFTRAVNGVSSGEGDVTVDVSGETVIVAEGEGSVGVYLLHAGNGSVHATIGARTRTAAPFGNGVYGRLMPSANAAGRIVIDARGRVEARDTGILAWAEPRSGSTFGEGNEAADETAGTAPMIHVTSSGDVTVGEGVMDDYIDAAVAGDDGTLSAGERAVLDAITAGDEVALTTALDALPDDYNDAWKARMRAFRAARGAERTDHHGSQGNAPGANARLAEEAAVEILDIPRAGIRAMALSHTEIADYVRRGGLGGTLSDDERTVLAAVLTGGDLEAALAALPADYTDNWKDGVRLRAMSYNAGEIQVDVTGGTIDSEGDGVHARYVVTHDRNGAIAVTVADGAEITGGRHGVFVGGAGLAAGNDDLRAQTVTVNGAVMGGTGAGVHLVGGGTVTVGETGRVGATSGMAVLSDGPGDLVATVAGTVEGDIRARGGGDLTLDVQEGGAVTGTVHDPAGPLTVRGSIGRLLYTNGGTVTVAATGRLTGVEGESEAIRSESGNLDVSVAGTVAGDLHALGGGDLDATISGTVEGGIRASGGGALTLDVREGGAVTGTVHDPAGLLTVHGSIGRLLYTDGGTVTVAATGRLTGVEGESEAIRSESGNLDVSVAGTVAGDLHALGGGDLDATISGTVEGGIRASGGGALTLDVREGGAVTGTVHDPAGLLTVHGSIGRLLYTDGGTVTVAATGRLTGVEGESDAVRSEAGDLSVTVAETGRVSGGVRGMGDGDLNATVAGTVDGDVVKEGAGDLTAMVSGRVEGDVLNRDGGDLIFSSLAGSTVTGSVHDPRSPMSVHGSVGRLLYSKGGNVRVAGTGRITGIEGIAIRAEAGDLVVRMDRGGEINGDVLALDGRLTLDLPADSVIEGTLHNPVGLEEVRGDIGRIVYDEGGTLTVTERGRLTGVVTGGRKQALLSRAGPLTLNVSDTVEGDVVARGAGEHVVIVLEGGVVAGTVRFVGGVNRVEVHEGARIASPEGRRGQAIANEGGTPQVAVRATGGAASSGALPRNEEDHTLEVLVVAGEEEAALDALRRIEGTLYDHRGVPDVRLQRGAGGELPVGRLGTRMAYADGVHDVGWVAVPEREDEFEFQEELAPRSRLYEALPSVLLGLNAPARYEERMAAARAEQGGWARVETVRGKWKADASTSQMLSGVELEYDHRRHGLQAGVDVAVGEDGLFGVSLHHRRGSADVSKGGKVELSGHGVGVSGAWGKGGVYVDVQAEATWYEADFTSSLRGVLKQDVSATGYALGVEAGRRITSGWAGMVLTPRAGLVHSRVFVGGFTDAVGTRVSVEDGGSLKGRAGMVVEVKSKWWARGSRVFGSVDVERELSKDRKVRVSGTELRSEADATWLRFGLNGSHALDGGRWTVAGRVGWATSGGSDELGGGLHLKMRF